MTKSTFDYCPELVEQEGAVTRINFDVESVEQSVPAMSDDDEPSVRTVYMAHVVRVEQPVTRSKIISAIVDYGYPRDSMDACVNNYLNQPDDEVRKAEFTAMQQWRTHAKEVADQVMGQTVG